MPALKRWPNDRARAGQTANSGVPTVNYQAWNQYVSVAIGLFGALLYIALLYAGLAQFKPRMFKDKRARKRLRNQATTRSLRNPKGSER